MKREVIGLAIASIVLLVVAIGMALLLDDELPRSTSGVTSITSNAVRLPAGDKLFLTHYHGGSGTDTAWITYDGQNVVQVELGLSLASPTFHKIPLCGLGCTATFDTGMFGIHLEITQHQDGAVTVTWPNSWSFRPHKPQ